MQEGDIGDMNYYWRQRLMEQFLQMEKMRENKDKYYARQNREIEKTARTTLLLRVICSGRCSQC